MWLTVFLLIGFSSLLGGCGTKQNKTKQKIREESRIPESEVIGFDSAEQMDNFMFNNLNTTQGGNYISVSDNDLSLTNSPNTQDFLLSHSLAFLNNGA